MILFSAVDQPLFVMNTTTTLFLQSSCDSETLPSIPGASRSKFFLSSSTWYPFLFVTIFSPSQQLLKKAHCFPLPHEENIYAINQLRALHFFWFVSGETVATIKCFQPAHGTSIKCLYTPIQTVFNFLHMYSRCMRK